MVAGKARHCREGLGKLRKDVVSQVVGFLVSCTVSVGGQSSGIISIYLWDISSILKSENNEKQRRKKSPFTIQDSSCGNLVGNDLY